MTERSERPSKRQFLTLSQAAKEVGKSKATISKAIVDGRLSVYERSSDGFKIDPAELFRVFAQNRSLNTQTERYERPSEQGERPQINTQNTNIEVLKVKLEAAEQLLRDRDRAINDLQQRLNKESDERRKLTEKIASLLLPAPADTSPQKEDRINIDEPEPEIESKAHQIEQAGELEAARKKISELETAKAQLLSRAKKYIKELEQGKIQELDTAQKRIMELEQINATKNFEKKSALDYISTLEQQLTKRRSWWRRLWRKD